MEYTKPTKQENEERVKAQLERMAKQHEQAKESNTIYLFVI